MHHSGLLSASWSFWRRNFLFHAGITKQNGEEFSALNVNKEEWPVLHSSIIYSKVHYYINLLVERSTPLGSSLIISAAAAAAVDEKLEYINRVLTSTKQLLS